MPQVSQVEFERALREVLQEQPGLTRDQVRAAIMAKLAPGPKIGAPPEFTGPTAPQRQPSFAEYETAARGVLDDPTSGQLDAQGLRGAIDLRAGYDQAQAGTTGPQGVTAGGIADLGRSGDYQGILDMFLDTVGSEGYAETAGAAVGQRVAGLPGRIAGAGLVGGARGLARGESFTDSALRAGKHAGIESIVPAIGATARAIAPRMVRSAVPISEREARDVGRGVLNVGAQRIGHELEYEPGLTIRGTHERMNRAYDRTVAADEAAARAATIAGPDIDPNDVVARMTADLGVGGSARSGTQGVVDEFGRIANAYGAQTGVNRLSADQARDILRNMRFTPAGAETRAGSTEAERALRVALGAEYRAIVPEADALLTEESRLIPLRRVLDRARFQVGQGQVRSPEVLLSGGRPRAFGVLPIPKSVPFTAGKLLGRAGHGVDDAALQQALAALMRYGVSESGEEFE